MASGDITAIKELGRFTIPGGGHTTAGAAKNDKVLAWGEITATYVAAGVNLSAKGGVTALGVSTLDFINLESRLLNDAAPASQANFIAELNTVSDKIFILEDVDAGTLVTDGQNVLLRYLVIGDSNAVADLT